MTKYCSLLYRIQCGFFSLNIFKTFPIPSSRDQKHIKIVSPTFDLLHNIQRLSICYTNFLSKSIFYDLAESLSNCSKTLVPILHSIICHAEFQLHCKSHKPHSIILTTQTWNFCNLRLEKVLTAIHLLKAGAKLRLRVLYSKSSYYIVES